MLHEVALPLTESNRKNPATQLKSGVIHLT